MFGQSKTDRPYPQLIFEIRPDDNLFIGCFWPEATSEEDMKKTIEQYSTLVYIVLSGKVLPGVQHAIANYKTQSEKNQTIAKAILFHIQNALKDGNPLMKNVDKNKPLISPSEAFSVRGVS